VIRGSGLVSDGDRGVAMVSGGADSVALLFGLAEVLGPDRLVALHVNYGLRPEADEDEALVRRHCELLGVECVALEAGPAEGNTQAWARDIRHGEAEAIRRGRGMDWIAIGHTRSDQAETFLYRLATSPGARPLLAMGPRSGHLIRPLLSLSREEVRRSLSGVAEWVEDRSNEDPGYARNRIRLEVIPELEAVNPAAQANISRTREELEEDEEALSRIAADLLADEPESPAEGVPSELFAGRHQAVVRRMLRILAERLLRRPVAITPEFARRFLDLRESPESRSLDLGGGARLRIESGRVLVQSTAGEEVGPVRLRRGRNRFGDWRILAEAAAPDRARGEFGDPWVGHFDLPGPDEGVTVRARRAGDRIHPLGMDGSASLQDVFVDARIPASRRDFWPVVVLDEEVLWVPGLKRSRRLLVGTSDAPVLRLQAAPPFPI